MLPAGSTHGREVLCSHLILHPCLTSGDTPDDTLVPQFTLLQAGTQGKPGALSHSSALFYLCQEASLGIQAPLQSDFFSQGPGTHSTSHKDPLEVPA